MRQPSARPDTYAQARRPFVAARMRRIERDQANSRDRTRQLLALATEDDVAHDVVYGTMAERHQARIEQADDWDGAA